LLLLLVDDLLVVSPEGVEVGELRLHQLLDHGLIPQHEGLLREAILGVLQQLSEGDAQAPGVRVMSLQALNEDPGDLLLDCLVDVIEEVDDHPGIEVGVAVDVPELIHDGVEQAHAGVRGQDQDDGLQDLIAFLLLCLLLLLVSMSVALDKEGHRVEDRRVDALAAVDELFALHHLICDGLDQVLILLLRPEVFLQVLS
jgi:hypothetical protein